MPDPERIAARLASIGAPVMPSEPPTTMTAGAPLVRVGRTGRHEVEHVVAVEHDRADEVVAHVDPDVGDLDGTGKGATGLQEDPRLAGGEGDRRIRGHGGADDRAGGAVDARRDVDREHRCRGRSQLTGEPGRVALQRAPQAGAVHGVDHEVRTPDCAGHGDAVDGRRELDRLDPHPPPAQDARGDEAVGAVVALAAHHDDPSSVAAVDEAAAGPGNGTAGALDEHVDRRPCRHRAGVGLGHRRRGDDRLHVRLGSAGRDRDRHRGGLGVRERHEPPGDASLPRELLGPAVERERRRAGVVVAHDLDVAEGEAAEPDAERLHHRFLRREAHRQARGGVSLLFGVRPLVGAEEPTGERRTTRQGEAEPVDLDQIGAEPDDPRAHARGQRSASTYTGSVSSSTTSNVASTSSSNSGTVSVTASLSAP